MTGNERTRDIAKAVLNVEIPRELKNRLERYAATEGISQSAATRILINDALTRSGYPRGPQ